jgi:hypothetical protein
MPKEQPPSKSGPTTPGIERGCAITNIRFRLFPVRSPLLRESKFFSFPQGTEMFHFPWFAFTINGEYLPLLTDGLPHSGIPGSKVVCTSPGLIAAYHALHRQLSPRHPLYALNCLATKFLNCQRTFFRWEISILSLFSIVKCFLLISKRKLSLPVEIILSNFFNNSLRLISLHPSLT